AGAVPHMVLVVRAGRTPHEVLERVQKEVASENVTIVGAILNQYRKFIPGWIYRWLIK
ncbi:MAG: hypothetical protein HYS04_13240, partial [Acidobacteria bacterium]|nr:hypothetical protein [Acidobacteriota bacterium]